MRSSQAQALEGASAAKGVRKEAADTAAALLASKREAATASKELSKAREQLQQQAHAHSEVGGLFRVYGLCLGLWSVGGAGVVSAGRYQCFGGLVFRALCFGV